MWLVVLVHSSVMLYKTKFNGILFTKLEIQIHRGSSVEVLAVEDVEKGDPNLYQTPKCTI